MNRLPLFSRVAVGTLISLSTISDSFAGLNEKESLALVRQAYQSLQSSEPLEAVRKYNEAIESNALAPEVLANAHLNRALAKQRLKQYEAAVADYTAALTTDLLSSSVRSTALYNRGLANHKLGHLPQSIEDYTSALLLNAQLAPAFLSRGQALRESGQLLFALSDFERALVSGHTDPARVNYLIGLTYEQLSRLDEAKRHYQAALHVKPDYKQAQERLNRAATARAQDTARSQAQSAPISQETELHKPGQKPAVQPPADLLAVRVPKPKAISERAPEQSAEIRKGDAARVGDVTASITPASADPEAQVELSVSTAEKSGAVAPESPVEDTVASATLPQDAAAEAVASVTEESPGWAVQISSATSLDGAKQTWAKLQAKNKVLKQLEPLFTRADLGAKGIVYRVRLSGFADKAKAQSECKKLKASGIDCFVSRT
jgi:tetratricopeptide (TPR) repeat protein